MTSAFEVRFAWSDGSGMRDTALAETSARVEVWAGGACVTRAWHRRLRTVVEGVEIALLPVAEWVADALPALCFEGPRAEHVRSLRGARTAAERAWHRRHGWLAWRAGFALPELVVSRASEGFVRLDWLRDPSSFDAMPVQFLEEGSAVAPRDVVVEELSRIVDAVLTRCEHLDSPELSALRERWALYADATATERRLLERAARLGLDAYDADEVDDALTALLEADVAIAEPVLDDLLDLGDSAQLEPQIAKLAGLLEAARDAVAPPSITERIGRARATLASPVPGSAPHEHGYECARRLRATSLGIGPSVVGAALDDAIADRVLPLANVRSNASDFLVRGIQGLAATSPDGAPSFVARPRPPLGRRFDRARALYSLVTGTTPRLVTSAFEPHQQAARAFAAELLAPAAFLKARIASPVVEREDLEALAQELEVDPRVVEHQIDNHALGEITGG
jgi:hypothetical protein